MDPWEKKPKPSLEDRYRSHRDHHHPSFSSTLLDQIYRSIDDSSGDGVFFYGDSMRKKKQHQQHQQQQQRDRGSLPGDHRGSSITEKIVVHRRSIATDFERSRAPQGTDSLFFKHSSSSSSDSSGFSSSESDSFYGRSRTSRSPPANRDRPAEIRQPKPIRTSVDRFERSPRSGVQKSGGKQELGSFLRTKSKALKIYSDLKKVKQPISPGGRLASFINSLFTAGNAKKLKKMSTATSGGAAATAVAAEQALSSTCSSASSFSRSCLSKTPSSTNGKSKRSVRFCPVSVILDEDSRPCGEKILYENEPNHNRDRNRNRNVNFDAVEIRVMEENRRVIEAAKDLLRTYQKKKDLDLAARTHDVDVININNGEDEDDEEEDDDDDAASYASSDLFELDNLSAIGIERYREELPVYETTHLDTNRAIANGLIV